MRLGGWLAMLVLVVVVSYAAWAAPAPVTVEVKDFKFTPGSVAVTPGTTVTWHNGDESPHTVTFTDGGVSSAGLERDDRFSYTFTKPGTYHYVCKIHPTMRADVVVR